MIDDCFERLPQNLERVGGMDRRVSLHASDIAGTDDISEIILVEVNELFLEQIIYFLDRGVWVVRVVV